MKLYTLALPIILAMTTGAKQCTVKPSSGTPEIPYGCQEYRAAVQYVCAPSQVLRCVPMQYWLEDTACAASLDAAKPSGVLASVEDCYELPGCSESGTNLKFVLSCVDMDTPCGSLLTSPVFVPIVEEVCE